MIKKLLFILLLIPCLAVAQSSGKIAGFVTDSENGEPLPGVNILIDGTTMGSATDVDGSFVILNVPVSTYTIRASYIGYQEVEIQNLRVSADLTTEADFELQPTSLEIGETIVVVAERPLVQKNVTSSISLVTNEEIELLPIRGIYKIANLTAGVVDQNGLHIRGSRSDEVGYYLGGVNTTNLLSSGTTVGVIQEAVEEFQVLAGGYTAEYGNANGGIIRTELRGGTPSFHAMVDFQTDKMVGDGEKFLNTYSYGYHNLVATVSGPLPLADFKYFLAFENRSQNDTRVRFSEGWSFENLIDDGVSNRRPDTLSLSYPDGFTPLNSLDRNTLNGTLTWDFSPIQVRFGGSYMHSNTKSDGNPQLNFLNTRQDERVTDSYLLNAKITHVINPTTFYNVDIGYSNYFSEIEDPYFGNNWRLFSDSLANAAQGIEFETRWNPYPAVFLYGFSFQRDGTPGGYNKTSQIMFNIGGDFVSQINNNNEIKAGLSYQAYTMRYYSVSPSGAMAGSWDSENQRSREYELSDITFGKLAGVDNYGYDVHGNESDATGVAGLEGPRQPLTFSAYLSDKIEFEDLIVNAGIRFDYYDSDDIEMNNPLDPAVDKENDIINEDTYKKVDPFQEISPRLGFSFPASESTVFYMQYGKFVQLPRLDNIYSGWRPISNNLLTGAAGQIPVGVDPIRTTSYEIGYRQELSKYSAFDLSLFYKNTKGQLQDRKNPVDPQAYAQAYHSASNADFVTSKGFELRLNLRRVERVQMNLNYTYSQAEGTGSSERAQWAVSNEPGSPYPTLIRPLDFERTHKGNVLLDYRFGLNDGGPILERLGLNIIFNFASGVPYTKTFGTFTGQSPPWRIGVDYISDFRTRSALEPLNASETPWYYNFDLRLDKTVTIADFLDLNIYLNVQNLFNTKNILYVYPFTGSDTDDGFRAQKEIYDGYISQFGPEYGLLYEAINGKNSGAIMTQGYEIYSNPRQIWLGIKLIY
jgi:hypothetical protein